jgi:hypothetical protein
VRPSSRCKHLKVCKRSTTHNTPNTLSDTPFFFRRESQILMSGTPYNLCGCPGNANCLDSTLCSGLCLAHSGFDLTDCFQWEGTPGGHPWAGNPFSSWCAAKDLNSSSDPAPRLGTQTFQGLWPSTIGNLGHLPPSLEPPRYDMNIFNRCYCVLPEVLGALSESTFVADIYECVGRGRARRGPAPPPPPPPPPPRPPPPAPAHPARSLAPSS